MSKKNINLNFNELKYLIRKNIKSKLFISCLLFIIISIATYIIIKSTLSIITLEYILSHKIIVFSIFTIILFLNAISITKLYDSFSSLIITKNSDIRIFNDKIKDKYINKNNQYYIKTKTNLYNRINKELYKKLRKNNNIYIIYCENMYSPIILPASKYDLNKDISKFTWF